MDDRPSKLCEKKTGKKIQALTVFEPMTLRFRGGAQPTELLVFLNVTGGMTLCSLLLLPSPGIKHELKENELAFSSCVLVSRSSSEIR